MEVVQYKIKDERTFVLARKGHLQFIDYENKLYVEDYNTNSPN